MNYSDHLPRLLEFLGEGFVVAMASLWIGWMLRRKSAARRHLVWLGTVGVLLALPLTVRGPVRVSPGGNASASERSDSGVVVWIPAQAYEEKSAISSAPILPEDFGARMRRWMDGQGWRVAFLGLWAAGVLVGSARWLWATVSLLGLRRHSRELAEPGLLEVAKAMAREVGVRRRVEWRVTEDVPVAMTWGWWRPVVMLPADALAWPRDRVELVLRHELAHVAKRDCLVRGLAEFARVLHWPNPLVWLIVRRLRLAQEESADDAVLAADIPADVYAQELLAAARAWGVRRTWSAAVSMAEPSALERRIRGVLSNERRETPSGRAVLAACAAAGLVLAGCSAVRVAQHPASAATKDMEPRSGGSGAARVERRASAEMRQVEVAIRFVELKGESGESFDANAYFGFASISDAKTNPALLGNLKSDDAERRVRDMSTRLGGNVLHAPRVTVLSGNRGTISVGEQLRYPRPVPLDPGHASGKTSEAENYETRTVGVEASVRPKILSDGSVAVDVQTMVREFEGYVGGPSAPGAGDEILVPLFVERADSATLVLRPGQVAVLQAGTRKVVAPEGAPDWARQSMTEVKIRDGQTVLMFIHIKVR